MARQYICICRVIQAANDNSTREVFGSYTYIVEILKFVSLDWSTCEKALLFTSSRRTYLCIKVTSLVERWTTLGLGWCNHEHPWHARTKFRRQKFALRPSWIRLQRNTAKVRRKTTQAQLPNYMLKCSGSGLGHYTTSRETSRSTFLMLKILGRYLWVVF